MDSVREGLILYGRRSSWDDPVKFMLDSWPWSTPPSGLEVGVFEIVLIFFNSLPDKISYLGATIIITGSLVVAFKELQNNEPKN